MGAFDIFLEAISKADMPEEEKEHARNLVAKLEEANLREVKILYPHEIKPEERAALLKALDKSWRL